MQNKAFHERLKQRREYMGITQVNMARELKVARQTYLDLESGKTEPRLGALMLLSEVLDTDITYFLPSKRPLQSFSTKELLKELMLRDQDTDIPDEYKQVEITVTKIAPKIGDILS